VLVRPHDRGIDHGVFVIRVSRQQREQLFPDTTRGPAAEAPVGIVPVTKRFREVAPRNAGTVSVQDRVHETAIVRRCHADRTRPARQRVLDAVPLVVAEAVVAHWSAFDEADALRTDECTASEVPIRTAWRFVMQRGISGSLSPGGPQGSSNQSA
jgi:hypothetical protein